MVFCAGAFAQSRKVSGNITDEGNSSLPGAIIMVKNASGEVKQTSTADSGGNYSVLCDKGDTIEFYYLGFDDQKIPFNGESRLDVKMAQSAATKLDDVVVIGYGSVKSSDLTGSVANVKMGELRDSPLSSIDQVIQGRVAGVDIMSTSGDPGATTSIRIRGTRSINASNEPLIVVDGVMDAVSDLNDINPADIESVSILKDASSTAIYGSRGSNGVILITTKSASEVGGVASNFAITFKATGGFSQLPSKLDIMDATEFAAYRDEMAQYSYLYTKITPQTPISSNIYKNPYALKEKSTDWIDEITRTAPYQDYLISMNGFSGNTKYYFSVGYNDKQGIIKRSGQRRVSINFNGTSQPLKWLTFNYRTNYAYRINDENLASIGGTSIYNSAIYLSPFTLPESKYNSLSPSGTKVSNPAQHIAKSTNETLRSMLTIAGSAEAAILKNLKFKTQVSFYRFDRLKHSYYPSTLPTREDGQGGQAYKQHYTEHKVTFDNTLNYWTSWGNHNFSAMIGSSLYDFTSAAISLLGQGYLVDDVKWNNLNAVTDKNTYSASSSATEKRTLSFFGRVNYDYLKRYYATLTVRTDGASNFAANKKWGLFPSLALRWNISAEKWMRGASNVDELSLKLSAGRSGNDAIGSYMSSAQLSTTTGGYLFDGQQPVAYYPSRIDSPDLTWEKTDLVNLGLSGSFLNSRLSFNLEGYISRTSDLLLWVNTAQSTGYSSRLKNVGITSNKGVELTVESRNIVKRNFIWSTSFSISHNTQTVEDIGSENYIKAYSAPETGYMMYGYVKGYPLNSLWGFQYAGVWKSDEEVERNKVTRARATRTATSSLGYPTYVDINHDGVLNSDDIIYLGNADPIVYGGLQNTFRIRKFTLGVFFAYSLGGKIFNFSELYMAGGARTNQYRYMINAWHPVKNPDSDLPRAGILDGADMHSERMIHDASYLRLKSVSLGYNINLRRSKVIREIALTLSGENLYLWKRYNGFDPDVSNSSDKGTIRRMDLGAYPKPRTVIFSIQMKY